MFNRYTPEQKASVLAAILTGSSINQAAKETGIPRSTVALWSHAAAQIAAVSTPKKVELGELIWDFLQESLITHREQMIFFRDPTWMRSQTANDMAILFGVTVDKTARLMASLRGEPMPALEEAS